MPDGSTSCAKIAAAAESTRLRDRRWAENMIDPSFTAPINTAPSGRGPVAGKSLIWSCPDVGPLQRDHPRTMPCPAGPGAVMPVKRINAVMLTAIAPITEKIICQVADGIAI